MKANQMTYYQAVDQFCDNESLSVSSKMKSVKIAVQVKAIDIQALEYKQ